MYLFSYKMISHSLKFIFIHIDKTGGSSLTLYLKNYIDDEIKMGLYDEINICNKSLTAAGFDPKIYTDFNNAKHLTIHEYRRYYDNKIVNDYFKFTIVRNPYDRFISMYFFILKRFGKLNDTRVNPEIVQHVIMRLRPQTDFLDNTVKIIKYENLIPELEQLSVFKNNNINFNNFPHLNKTDKKFNIFTYANLAAINEKFHFDFVNFGYQKKRFLFELIN